MTTSTVAWKDIATCPRIDGKTYLGYDKGAESWGDTTDGLCLITWFDEDDDEPEGWSVQSFNDGFSEVFDDRTNITLWADLHELSPAKGDAS